MSDQKFKTAQEIFEGRLRGNQLIASSIAMNPQDARLLWGASLMESVTWLDLDDNCLGDQGLRELADCSLLSKVRYLNLNNNKLTDDGIIYLAESPHLSNLKRLHLKGNLIQGKGVLALFNSETLESLQTFQIHDGWSCKKREGWRYKSRD
tara:strand:- start:2218 stop:2670 length:453 start_codon:yes stop_codon:yes gene_type:complete